MKIMLIVENEEIRKILTLHLKPLGYNFIHYNNPVKAIDNIEEVEPEIVLFSAEDFPRHWKPFITLLRCFRTKTETVFILLRGNNFSFEEAAKAIYLGVNGIIKEDLTSNKDRQHLENIFLRYSKLKENRAYRRYIPDYFDEIDFMFTHPENMKIISGKISDISEESANFNPDNPEFTESIKVNSEIPFCSLRIGDKILRVRSQVLRNNKNMVLKFINMSEEHKKILLEYIDNRVKRELEFAKSDSAELLNI